MQELRWTTVLAVGVMVVLCLVGAAIGSIAHPVPAAVPSDAGEVGGWTGLAATFGMMFTFLLGWAFTGMPMVGLWKSLKGWRVEIHNWISIAILGLAGLHTFLFTAAQDYRGWVSGWLSNVLMVGLFVTGWWRPYYVKKWGRPTWRVVHWELALGAILFALVHWIGIEHGKSLLGWGD